mgnify:FL=1
MKGKVLKKNTVTKEKNGTPSDSNEKRILIQYHFTGADEKNLKKAFDILFNETLKTYYPMKD